MTKIVDNSKEKLASELQAEFKHLDEIAIASAYFNIRGYGALKQGLADRPLLFLLGREPTESVKWEEELLRELEQEEDDTEYFDLLQETIRYFESPKRQIRLLEGPFFHGKTYIGASPGLQEARNGVGVVGSSNFTYGGLISNRELNMFNTDREVVQELIAWFEDQWKSAKDFKETFLSFLKNYITTRSPYEVVAKALYEVYKDPILASEETLKLKTLLPHQVLSYRDASLKLTEYGGVVVADSTGLGKSRTALRLALDAIRDEKKVLLIAPKSILDTTWRDEMKTTNIHLETESSEKLSSDPDYVLKEHADKNFIVVDEAHYFRSPSTSRYAALSELITKNKAQVVLATATPVNTSLMDLYSLLSLYLKEDCVNDLCNQTLKGYFTANQKRVINGEPINMDAVLNRFIVRHSRELAKALDREGRVGFPERILDQDLRDKYSNDVDYLKIDEALGNMNFAFYDLSIDRLGGQFRLPDGTTMAKAVEEEKRESLKKLVKTIVIINMFKRLESSTTAFAKTLRNLGTYIAKSIVYAKQNGYFVPPALKSGLLFGLEEEAGDEEQEDEEMLAPEELFSKPKYKNAMNRLKMTPEEIADFENKGKQDQETIRKIISLLPEDDKKCNSFSSRVSDLPKEMEKTTNNGVIVFTQYVDTASYLYERLRREKIMSSIMLTTGQACYDSEGKSATKSEVVRDFQRRGGILVSTDVLSAGQNLQNAQYVVNYDFPWNPVVLIQRIGRIDRMGSSHNEVYLINVLPKNGDPEDHSTLEYFLGLMSRLYSRLESIRATIGLDATTLGETAIPKDFGIQTAIAKNDPRIIDLLTRQLEQFTNSPIDTLARIMNERGLEWLKSLPKGLGAYKQNAPSGLFVLFTDGQDFYWRLKYAGQNDTITSPNEIIDTLLQGENHNSGENISYEPLIGLLREMKADLKSELEEQKRREATIEGTVARATASIREIYDALAKSGSDGEKLAVAFRKAAGNANVVRALQRAMREGDLEEKARDLLMREVASEEDQNTTGVVKKEEDETKLTRVCWCWLQN